MEVMEEMGSGSSGVIGKRGSARLLGFTYNASTPNM